VTVKLYYSLTLTKQNTSYEHTGYISVAPFDLCAFRVGVICNNNGSAWMLC